MVTGASCAYVEPTYIRIVSIHVSVIHLSGNTNGTKNMTISETYLIIAKHTAAFFHISLMYYSCIVFAPIVNCALTSTE